MKSDHEIELDVKDELQWDPNLDATDIAVSVKKDVVTLAICLTSADGGHTTCLRQHRF